MHRSAGVAASPPWQRGRSDVSGGTHRRRTYATPLSPAPWVPRGGTCNVDKWGKEGLPGCRGVRMLMEVWQGTAC
jgi:hypothetical protein